MEKLICRKCLVNTCHCEAGRGNLGGGGNKSTGQKSMLYVCGYVIIFYVFLSVVMCSMI